MWDPLAYQRFRYQAVTEYGHTAIKITDPRVIAPGESAVSEQGG